MESVGIFVLLLSWLSISTFPVWFGSASGLFLMCGKSHTIIKSHTTHSMVFYDFCWWFGNVCFIGSFCCRKDFNRKTSRESCIRWLCKKIQTHGMGDAENIKASNTNWAFFFCGHQQILQKLTTANLVETHWKEKTVTQYVSRRNVTQWGCLGSVTWWGGNLALEMDFWFNIKHDPISMHLAVCCRLESLYTCMFCLIRTPELSGYFLSL